MNLFKISWKSLWARPWSTLMSLLLFVMGVGIISLLLLLNKSLDDSFKKNIRGIDMVVGAKGSPLQLILSSVYHIDNPTGNIPLKEAERLKKHPLVSKGIPLAYGDNYKGYKILGTETEYVDLYEGKLQTGEYWNEKFEVVLGGILAERLGMGIGDEFFSSHGLVGDLHAHEDFPFTVVGILQPSGTVLDQLILTGIESIWGVHETHEEHDGHGAHDENGEHDEHRAHDENGEHDEHGAHDENGEHDEHGAHREHGEHSGHENHEDEEKEKESREITAMLIKFRSPMGMMQLPRMVNTETSMQAALPAIEVNRLFDLFAVGINLIRGIAFAIMVISGISIFISLYNNLLDRKYELALMRSLGASREELFSLVLLEGLILAVLGFIGGVLLSRIGIYVLDLFIQSNYRYDLDVIQVMPEEFWLLAASLLLGCLAALLPARNAWKTDIADTLSS